MTKEELKQKLKKYNYKFKEQFDVVIVNLSPSLEVRIDYNDPDRVIISDKLIGYNVLTGVWSMSIKGSIIFNGIMSLVYALFFAFLIENNHSFDLYITFFFIIGMAWIILWTNYFHVKADNFKTLIKSWDR